MNSSLLLLLIGFLFIVIFGGLSWFRREGLSRRFAIEALLLTVAASGLVYFGVTTLHPIVFLILIYIVTMRARLLVDVANFFSRRGKFSTAERIYETARSLWPDPCSELIIEVNQGVSLLHQGRLDAAIIKLRQVLEKAGDGYLGVKYESASHYNLGVAYRRQKNEPQAVKEFQTVLDTWPNTIFARHAAAALRRSAKQ